MTTNRSGYAKGPSDFFEQGQWNARCDQCYRKLKAGGLLRQWDGLMVCSRCWDPRHPQELVQPIRDPEPPPWTRPDPPPIFTNPSGYFSSRSLNGAPFNYQSLD